MNFQVKDIIKYNTDWKIAGNTVEVRHYKEKGQIKGYSVDAMDKELLQAKYERILKEMVIEGYSQTSINYFMDEVEKLIEENKKNNFEKSNKRAKDMIIDLVSCNHDLFTDYDGKESRLKFLTLSFDPKKYDSKFEEYKTVYKTNKAGQRYAVEYPKNSLYSSRYLLTDYKHCYGEITKFFKRLSYELYGVKKNVIKYICVPELHKSDMAFHFHIILFNMPYLRHADYMRVWSNGGVYIEAIPNGSAGSVAKYVAKYLTKSQDDKNASYEQYKDLGLENMKRYSCSRGLKKPMKRSVMMKQETIEGVIAGFNMKGKLETINKEGDKFRKKEVEGFKLYDDDGKEIGRGDMVCYTFRLSDKQALDDMKRMLNGWQELTLKPKKEGYKKPSWKQRQNIIMNQFTDEFLDKACKSKRLRSRGKGLIKVNYSRHTIELKPNIIF